MVVTAADLGVQALEPLDQGAEMLEEAAGLPGRLAQGQDLGRRLLPGLLYVVEDGQHHAAIEDAVRAGDLHQAGPEGAHRWRYRHPDPVAILLLLEPAGVAQAAIDLGGGAGLMIAAAGGDGTAGAADGTGEGDSGPQVATAWHGVSRGDPHGTRVSDLRIRLFLPGHGQHRQPFFDLVAHRLPGGKDVGVDLVEEQRVQVQQQRPIGAPVGAGQGGKEPVGETVEELRHAWRRAIPGGKSMRPVKRPGLRPAAPG